MPEQHRHLANKCEDIVNLQGAEAYCVAKRTACSR